MSGFSLHSNDEPLFKFDWALAPIIALNLFPLVMALMGYFDGNELLIAYWLELLVVGVITVIKIISANYPSDMSPLTPAYVLALFILPYLGVCYLLGRLLFYLLGLNPADVILVMTHPFQQSDLITLWIGMLCLCHGLPLVTRWLLAGERRNSSILAEMLSPYGRVVLLFATLVTGTILGVLFELNREMAFSLGPLCILVAGKTTFDIYLHRAERERAERLPDPAIAPSPPRHPPLPPE